MYRLWRYRMDQGAEPVWHLRQRDRKDRLYELRHFHGLLVPATSIVYNRIHASTSRDRTDSDGANRGARVMIRYGAGIAVLALTACVGRPVATFTAGDLTTAQSIATAGGDATGAACWGSLLPAVQAFRAGSTVGAATLTEIARVAILKGQGPCGPLIAPIMAQLSLLPGAANIIAAAASSVLGQGTPPPPLPSPVATFKRSWTPR